MSPGNWRQSMQSELNLRAYSRPNPEQERPGGPSRARGRTGQKHTGTRSLANQKQEGQGRHLHAAARASSRKDRKAHCVKLRLRLLAIKHPAILTDMLGPGRVLIVRGRMANKKPLAYPPAALFSWHCELLLALEFPCVEAVFVETARGAPPSLDPS